MVQSQLMSSRLVIANALESSQQQNNNDNNNMRFEVMQCPPAYSNNNSSTSNNQLLNRDGPALINPSSDFVAPVDDAPLSSHSFDILQLHRPPQDLVDDDEEISRTNHILFANQVMR